MTTYNLSIACVDGDTIYALISSDKELLLNFLRKHDHEGSTVSMVKHEGGAFEGISNPDLIYRELSQ